VTLPSWRLDLEREIDLIEEVARVYGYNRFANTLPAFGEGVRALPWAEKESAVRRTLLAAGFHEAIASTFCSAAEAALTRRSRGWWFRWAIRSAKRRACCGRRWCRECWR
jgi:phenylalanyl-tRNA synthetase beta chain